ncbi:glycosyltransferase family 4 protein [Agaribacterium sp. ZY112]|uniref:glycosyltransferase family 4 protein n=1 Tax=Agaribacterium sp. ZY112 TaxID=3233574 RepID=UPI0035246B3F
MKILHVAETIKGGVETYLRLLCEYQIEQGDEPILLCNEPVDWLDSDKQYVFPRESRGLKGLLELARSYKAILKESDAQVIHLHGTFAGLIGRVLRRSAAGRPLVYCAHGWAYDRGDGVLRYAYMFVEWLLSFFCDAVIAISEHDAERYVGGRGKLVLIENALADAFDVPPSFPDKKTLLYVGRLDRQKGIDLLVKAYDDGAYDFDLLVVGDSVLADATINTQKSRCQFLGWLSAEQLQQLYGNVSAQIIPSRWEGFGLVALEAMAASKMVLASNVGGLTKLVHGAEGIVFEANYDGLVEALRKFDRIESAEIVHKGQVGRAFYEQGYRIERLGQQVKALYSRLCG